MEGFIVDGVRVVFVLNDKEVVEDFSCKFVRFFLRENIGCREIVVIINRIIL